MSKTVLAENIIYVNNSYYVHKFVLNIKPLSFAILKRIAVFLLNKLQIMIIGKGGDAM